LKAMNAVTRILCDLQRGDAGAAEQLLPLVYSELRQLAAQRLSRETPGQTLQATALVHEAYLRLVDVDQPQQWDGRGHFFAAAAEAMRRILIDNARRRKADKRGGGWERIEIIDAELVVDTGGEELFAVDAALAKLATQEPQLARLVELRFFAGLTMQQAAQVLDLSLRSANRQWSYARAWLRRELDHSGR
jgi:RNA polymerase sigma factor (TIGR02999 family)